MKTLRISGLICVLAFAAPSVSAHDPSEMHAMPSNWGEKLGTVNFPTSCSPAAQQQFERALAMLHSFFFPETVKAFNAVLKTDPQCAIAYWGLAVSMRPNPLVGPFDEATLKKGLEADEKGKAIGAKTERERDWLSAIEPFYKDYDKIDQGTRASAYEEAMGKLMQKVSG
jgi:hypothetical protein